jgi:hypothetical protein
MAYAYMQMVFFALGGKQVMWILLSISDCCHGIKFHSPQHLMLKEVMKFIAVWNLRKVHSRLVVP